MSDGQGLKKIFIRKFPIPAHISPCKPIKRPCTANKTGGRGGFEEMAYLARVCGGFDGGGGAFFIGGGGVGSDYRPHPPGPGPPGWGSVRIPARPVYLPLGSSSTAACT